jgi:trans-2,3-dihydro-3-hydroxyanthranilate isomerase
VIPVTHEAAVRRAKPVGEILARLSRDGGERMAYLFAPMAAPERLLARFFFPQGGAVIEDPATGSATANLGGWFLAMGRPLPLEFEISQGEYAGRPSTLFLHVASDHAIRVSGEVIVLGMGTITL